MTQRIHERIREILEVTPGLTQKGLAERMGLDPAAVNRMLYGRRNIMAEELPIIEEYIGIRLCLSAPPLATANMDRQKAPAARPGHRIFSDGAPQTLPAEAPDVPVYGMTANGQSLNFAADSIADWAPRHPAQSGIDGAFAVYVFTDAMAPRYFQGELVYVHPRRPLEISRDCIIEMKNGGTHIKRFLRHNGGHIRVEQFNPPREEDIAKSDIKAIYAIIARG